MRRTFRPVVGWVVLCAALAVTGGVVVAVAAGPAVASPGPAFRAAATGTGSPLTLSKPAEVVAGDVLVVSVAKHEQVGPGGRITAPAGWQLVTDVTIRRDLELATYVRVAEPTEPASYTWETGDPDSNGVLVAYSGVDPASPVAAFNSGVTPDERSEVRVPSFDVPVADSVLVMFATVEGPQVNPITPPAGMTERAEAPVHPTTAAADMAFPASGPTGDQVATAEERASSIGTVLALRPAPV